MAVGAVDSFPLPSCRRSAKTHQEEVPGVRWTKSTSLSDSTLDHAVHLALEGGRIGLESGAIDDAAGIEG